jgi:Fe-S cluster biogenesis protein NfuA
MLHVVDVELTPNPQAIKFVLNQKLLHFTSRQFNAPEDAEKDPLAKGVFELEGVESVFYMDKFITVEKKKDCEWGKIQRPFLTFLSKFDAATIPEESIPEGMNQDTSELLKQISEVLNKKVVPALAYDGGGLEVIGLDGYALKVRYQGACGSCPSAQRGTLSAIESLLRRDVHPALEVIPD